MIKKKYSGKQISLTANQGLGNIAGAGDARQPIAQTKPTLGRRAIGGKYQQYQGVFRDPVQLGY